MLEQSQLETTKDEHCRTRQDLIVKYRSSISTISSNNSSDKERLLCLQGILSPSVINVSSSAVSSFMLSLSAEPDQDVQISVQSPTAAWNPSQALAAISPGKLTFGKASWQLPQQVSVIPSGISIGDWFINITYR